jgi:hypothetical protein
MEGASRCLAHACELPLPPLSLPMSAGEDDGGDGGSKTFISAVSWRPGSQVLLVASSQGTIRCLQLTGNG